MPKLKRLELQGFKSFADPFNFLYPTGITAIVGPNGSGKSNVADAIRWVLGEQRLTSIRGRTGEDMIFAGSPRRSRSGMARAAITFDNADGWLPVDFAEVTVERRTYRDGTSDYLLNGNRVRLMDLRDLLDRSGLGRDAYLVIGQGLVDQVLSLRPTERLALFEQAAGITPYRTRREDAVRHLEETKGNLQRVYDIVGELEPRLRRLERQAAKADEHARLKQELNETLRVWYGYRWDKHLSDLEQARQRVAYREDKALSLLERTEALGTQVGEQRKQINQYREQLAQLHRESGDQHDKAGKRQQELAVARERQRQLHERIEESRSNLVPLRSALASEKEDIDTLRANLAEAETQLRQAQDHLTEAQIKHQKLTQQRNAVLCRQAGIQAHALETRHRLVNRQSRLEQAEGRLQELDSQLQELQLTVETGTERRRAQQRGVEIARRSLEEAEAKLTKARAEAVQADEALETARGETEDVRKDLTRLQANLQRTSARLEALDRLAAEGASMYAGVRAALQAVEHGELQGLPGPVSSLVHVPAELERAIEAALGSQLQNVVAESWDDAQAAIQWLKRKRAGRATFLPLDNLRPPRPLEVPSIPGVIGLGSDLVDYDPAYKPAVHLLLARTVIAQSLDAARRLHHELHGSFRIVTLDGEIVRSGGSVTGGENRNSQGPGLLSRERERRELRQEVGKTRRDVKETQTRLAELEERVQSLTQTRSALHRQYQEAEKLTRRLDREVEEATRQLERVLQQTQWQESRLADARQEQEKTKATLEKLGQEAQEAQVELDKLGAQEKDLGTQLSDLADDDTARLVAERRTKVAVLAQERESQSVLLDSRLREITRLGRQIEAQEHRIRSLEGELEALDNDLDVLAVSYETARSMANTLAAQVAPLEARLAEIETSLAGLEQSADQARRALREAEQRLNQAEVDAGRREDRVQALRREIEETLEIVISNLPDTISTQQPLPLDDIVSHLPTISELPQGLENQIHDLRTQIRRLEPVNTVAKEEYAELSGRHGFLREQMEDLERASAHLRKIIGELDEMMDTMFSTTFSSIATEFSRSFELLFNGGSSRLVLVDEEGVRTGVEITARPPSKRTANLDVLSGGERSLTAVALIFAVMRVSPTPFCVLDEVDAMLDEVNVGRFRRFLQRLARDTQFVIITHNRATLEVADTIYGVSMGEDGVSNVLSLSLEDFSESEAI